MRVAVGAASFDVVRGGVMPLGLAGFGGGGGRRLQTCRWALNRRENHKGTSHKACMLAEVNIAPSLFFLFTRNQRFPGHPFAHVPAQKRC